MSSPGFTTTLWAIDKSAGLLRCRFGRVNTGHRWRVCHGDPNLSLVPFFTLHLYHHTIYHQFFFFLESFAESDLFLVRSDHHESPESYGFESYRILMVHDLRKIAIWLLTSRANLLAC